MSVILNTWVNQIDPLIPQRLRTPQWCSLVAHAPATPSTYDTEVEWAINDWVYRRLLPMLTPVASFSHEGDEWRAMIDRRVLNMHKFKNFTLNKILRLLNEHPKPQYGHATRLALREIHTLRKMWRGFHIPWVKDLDINNTLVILCAVSEHGRYPAPTPTDP